MKKSLLSLFIFVSPLLCTAENPPPPKPEGALNPREQAFVGKWKGSRLSYKWEIDRKADRTFEIVFTEPDPEDPSVVYKNYAVGIWWVKGDEYYYEWKKWWGAPGELGGVQMEKVSRVEADKVVTLSEDDVDPNNIEIRVKAFRMPEWKLKPAGKK